MRDLYCRHYGLTESPFALTPDPRYLFLTDAHQEALAAILYGVGDRKGFVVVLGEVGTGKTTLIRHALCRLDGDVRPIYVFNAVRSFDELLQAMLRELEIPAPAPVPVRWAMVEALYGLLLREAGAGRSVALIIDEAQHLSAEILEELRMLSNLETTHCKLLQIVLVGQPELAQKLARFTLRPLRQRIALVAELRPLTRPEVAAYVVHRLATAGYTGRRVFTRGALRAIHAASAGIPRRINAICDKALVLGFAAGTRTIDRSAVRRVVRDWDVFQRAGTRSWRARVRHDGPRRRWPWRALARGREAASAPPAVAAGRTGGEG